MWFWIVFGVLICVVLYLVLTYFSVYTDIKMLPKKDMFWCSTHGPIAKDAVIKFMNTEYCPRCFHSTLSNAEKI
jgi:hypothetical protein